MSLLFTPVKLGEVALANRIVVSPMCQYSANDGVGGDWHLHHLIQFGYSGAGLVTMEATAVERRGRITHGCLGLYSDACETALARVIKAARSFAGPACFGIQLAHAGRKASAHLPWEGGGPLGVREDAWRAVAPSSVPFAAGWPAPEALDEDGIERVLNAFVDAARRTSRIGFDVVEVHAAHGYLLHEFLSPASNKRTDSWGGSQKNRMRFPLAVVSSVRAALPPSVAVGVRITGTDWLDGGCSVDDAVTFARHLKELDINYVCVSSGGITQPIQMPQTPGYNVPLAAKIKKETGISTQVVGMILTPSQAEDIVKSEQADMVCLARCFLDDPRWVWHAAEEFNAPVHYPLQYERARRSAWKGAEILRPGKGKKSNLFPTK